MIGKPSIPKGLRPSAQSCEERATLGKSTKNAPNPERVVASDRETPQAATLSGLKRRSHLAPRVARSSAPWALRRNPVGIRRLCCSILLFLSLLSAAASLNAAGAGGVLPTDKSGRALNLDFEDGTLRDWVAEGDAFAKQPVKGDT